AVPQRLALDALRMALADAASLPEAVAELVAAVHRDAAWAKVKLVTAVLVVCASLVGGTVGVIHVVRPTPTEPVAFVPALPPEEAGRGKAVRGLRLVLDAGNGEATLARGAAHADPIALRVQFRNEADKPIKVKTGNLQLGWEPRYEIAVTGPDADSVRVDVQ